MIRQLYRDTKRLLTHNRFYRRYKQAMGGLSTNYLAQLINAHRKAVGLRLIALFAIAIVVYIARPLFHGLFYSIAYSPSAILTLGIPLIVAIGLFILPRLEDDLLDSILTKAVIFGAIFCVMLVIGTVYAIPAGMVTNKTIAQDTMADSEQLDQFPQVNQENPRVVPKDVADTQTRGSVSYRTHTLGESDIARMEDGRLAWSYAIEPQGPRNTLLENQRGVVMSDMTSIDTRTIQAHDDTQFKYGEGVAFSRHALWQAQKGDYDAEYNDDPVEFTHEGTPYMAYPKTGHEWHLTPMPHTTPTWEGVALVHPDGTIEHLSPEEARQSEILDGQRLYPLYNTRVEMESLGYRQGIWNQTWFGEHAGQIEIASLPDGAGNSQPFVIDLADRKMVYVTAMEPYGEGTDGLDEVWFADSQTGQYYYYGTGNDSLTGPKKAMGIAKGADTQTGWGENFEVQEPVPVTVNDQLWWHIKVVPTDHTDVSRNVFVNAHTGEPVELYNDQSVRQFLAGEDPEEIEDVSREQADDNSSVSYYVVVTGEDGSEIDRIPIEEGRDVSIVKETNQNETGNTTAQNQSAAGA